MNPSTAVARRLVSALVGAGVEHVVYCPGSRDAPIGYALADAEAAGWLRVYVRLDERSAGFVALGLGRAGCPAAVVTTSGTAVANIHPAVLEADAAGVPLIVLSADRPAEMWHTGANQTTVQTGIFGSAPRLSTDVPAGFPAGGYQHPKPMVYSGLFPIDAKDFPDLRDALDKLQLNDAALVYEPETSTALGFGFRVGFLGLLHMEIVRERLEREFDLDLISTAPSVVHHVLMEDGSTVTVTNPSEYPTSGRIAEVREPIVDATILSPAEYIGTILELCQQRRGVQQGLDYLSSDRVEIRYRLPLSEIVFDFFDQLKSRTKGYASLDYHEAGEQAADLVKVDILLNGDPVDALSSIVHRDKSYSYGVAMAAKLKELIPRQQFEVPVQAAIGARVIARETIRAVRKDVLAKCYGGDISRKRKLLEKQKAGKKRMKVVGSVEVPQEAFVAALRTGESTEKK